MQFDLSVTNGMPSVVRVRVTHTLRSHTKVASLSFSSLLHLSPLSTPPIHLILHSSLGLSPSSVCPLLISISPFPSFPLSHTVASRSVSLFPSVVISALSVSPSACLPLTPSLSSLHFTPSSGSPFPPSHLCHSLLSFTFILSPPLSPSLTSVCTFISPFLLLSVLNLTFASTTSHQPPFFFICPIMNLSSSTLVPFICPLLPCCFVPLYFCLVFTLLCIRQAEKEKKTEEL